MAEVISMHFKDNKVRVIHLDFLSLFKIQPYDLSKLIVHPCCTTLVSLDLQAGYMRTEQKTSNLEGPWDNTRLVKLAKSISLLKHLQRVAFNAFQDLPATVRLCFELRSVSDVLIKNTPEMILFCLARVLLENRSSGEGLQKLTIEDLVIVDDKNLILGAMCKSCSKVVVNSKGLVRPGARFSLAEEAFI